MKSGNLTESGSWNDRRGGLSLGRGTVEAGSQLSPNPTSGTNPECLKLYRPVPADGGKFHSSLGRNFCHCRQPVNDR